MADRKIILQAAVTPEMNREICEMAEFLGTSRSATASMLLRLGLTDMNETILREKIRSRSHEEDHFVK